MLNCSKTDDGVHTDTQTHTHTVTVARDWKLDHSTEEMREKGEPVQTDFTDDVISKSNAANERA